MARKRLAVAAVLLMSGLALPPAAADDPLCAGLTATRVGTTGDDVLRGTAGRDVIVGLGGNDRITAGGGDDVVCAGRGDDYVAGGRGNDRLYGQDGADRLVPGVGNDLAHGGTGSDLVTYAHSKHGVWVDLARRFARGSGDDRVVAIERVQGSIQADLLLGSAARDELSGGGGDDRIQGRGGNDRLTGGRGDDVLDGGAGTDYAIGSGGNDACRSEAAKACERRSLPQVVYVGPGGNADGASPYNPLPTMRAGLQRLRPGGTLWVLPGTYREGLQTQAMGGAATSTVTGVARPALAGAGNRTLGFFCEECRNVVFQGFEVRGFTDVGAGGTLSSGLTIRDLVVHHNGATVQLVGWELEGYGIHIDDSTGVLIEDVVAHHNGPDPPVLPDRILGTGINTFGLVDAEIRDCVSYRNHGGGFLIEDSVNVLFEGNLAYENDLDASVDEWWDGGLWLDGGRDVTVRGNTFRDNLGAGIEISDEELQQPTGYVLENNVSTGNYFGVFVWNFGTTGWPGAIARSGNDFTGNVCRDVWIARWEAFEDCP